VLHGVSTIDVSSAALRAIDVLHRITANRLAIATACVRLFALSFMLMFRKCVRTVLSETNSFSAIALLE
jgi:hypothetical protein